MPPGFGALLLVGMAALVGGELMVVDDSNWWETCKAPVCTVAEEQAEGLARLRVLSNYIKETMTLMGSVVASLDNEMQEVGRELRTIVGRRCHARGHAALTALVTHINQTDGADNEIVEVESDADDSWTSSSEVTQESSSVWSSDVDATSGFSSISQTTSHSPGSTSHGTYHGTSQRPSSTSHATGQHTTSTWRGSFQYPSSTSQTTQHHGSDLLTSSSTSSSPSHSSSTTSDISGKTLYRRPSSTLKKYEAESAEEYESPYVAPSPPETSDWRGGGRERHGQGYGPGHGRGGGHSRGRGQGGGRGRGRGQSLGLNLGLVSVSLGSSECWGVPVGSPHYVPGLDSWCATNCASGFCPETHCICP